MIRISQRSGVFYISGTTVSLLPLKASLGYSLRVFVYGITFIISLRILSYRGFRRVK
jgi:hypothetical protein